MLFIYLHTHNKKMRFAHILWAEVMLFLFKKGSAEV